jgi:hypothetical protein
MPIDPENLLRFRERLNEAGEYLCGKTDDPEAVKAYTAILYVQSSLALDAKEMKLGNEMIGKWLSAALEDPYVCDEMKSDIRDWLGAGPE